MLDSGAGSAEVSDESALAGAAAAAGTAGAAGRGRNRRGRRRRGHFGQRQRCGGAGRQVSRASQRPVSAVSGHNRREALHQLRRGGPTVDSWLSSAAPGFGGTGPGASVRRTPSR